MVSDAGAVAGMDSKGLFLAPEAGPFARAGVTNAPSLRLDPHDDVWFARKGGVEKWTATGIGALDLAWAAWGYSGDLALLLVNTRGPLLVRATKAGGGPRRCCCPRCRACR